MHIFPDEHAGICEKEGEGEDRTREVGAGVFSVIYLASVNMGINRTVCVVSRRGRFK